MVNKMIHLFFAAGHYHYTRYASYFVQSMESMTDGVRLQFMKGQHTMRVSSTVRGATCRFKQPAPNDTAYKRWSCHSGLKLLCKLCRTSPPLGARFTIFWAYRPCGPAGWLALLLTKAGDVDTNPGPTTLNKKVWICDICHKQIYVRKQISIRCNSIEHWVHLRCAGILQAQIPGPAI